MGRLTSKPLPIPDAVTVSVEDHTLRVRGPKGELTRSVPPNISVSIDEAARELIYRTERQTKKSESLLGSTAMHARNSMQGVTEGFSKTLEIEGVGYRAALEGGTLVLSLGFSHPVRFTPPVGVAITMEKNTITVSGVDKELVGQTAATIRSYKEPEPYKGKGIRYSGEQVRRKAGKKAGTTA